MVSLMSLRIATKHKNFTDENEKLYRLSMDATSKQCKNKDA